MHIVLDNFNLSSAERLLCETALTTAGSIVEAAKLLGITRHALKRRIIKHGIRWSREGGRIAGGPGDSSPGPFTSAASVGTTVVAPMSV